MDNKIEIFEKNTQTLAVHVEGLSNLSLYTPYLTVKKRASDTAAILSKTGVVSDPSTTYVFNLTTTDTSINVGDYWYDITLIGSGAGAGLGNHTIVKDRFSILDAVKDLT